MLTVTGAWLLAHRKAGTEENVLNLTKGTGRNPTVTGDPQGRALEAITLREGGLLFNTQKAPSVTSSF